MKLKSRLLKALALLCLLSAQLSYAQKSPVQELTNKYNSFQKHEISLQNFLQANSKNISPNAIGSGLNALYSGCKKLTTLCTNGDFESGLDTTQWQGAFGTWGSGDPDPYSLTEGFMSGAISDFDAHQTIVTAGTDPVTGISMVAPNGGTRSLRLGNYAINYGTELLSKTVTVTSAQTIFPFLYALVFEDPGHPPADQPAFSVRAFDCATGQELMGVCDLGNGSNKAVSDAQNPFFKSAGNGSIAYRDWSVAQINLSQYIGKTVNVVFTNKDCGQGGHYGYTYLDGLCSTGTTGFTINLDSTKTDTCGTGQICTIYHLPQVGAVSGQVIIDLDIYQNGAKVKTISSPVLTQDSAYCFSIDPGTLGLSSGLSGFDYIVTGRFSINTSALSPLIVGQIPEGQKAGSNNDYFVSCDSTQQPPPPPPPTGNVPQCCSGINLIKNPGFEQGNTGFTSGYTYQPQIALESVKPGYYTVANSSQARSISPTWQVNCDTLGNHLLVNGQTGFANQRKLVWRQDVTVDNGKKYKFCVNLKNLPQNGFDVKPNVDVVFANQQAGVTVYDSVTKVIDVPAGVCVGDLVERELNVPGTSSGTSTLTISIYLREDSLGDGNDLAIDNLSLVEMKPIPTSDLLLNVSFFDVKGSTFGISTHPIVPISANCTPNWRVSEVDAGYNVIASTVVNNPSEWTMADPNMFNGYAGTSILGDTSMPGIFQLNKRYRIDYGRTCECSSANTYSTIIDPVGSGGSLNKIRVFAAPQQNIVGKISTGGSTEDQVNKQKSLINNDATQKAFNVYPNPVQGVINVEFSRTTGNSRLVIYEIKGSVMKEISVKPGNTKALLNTNSLVAGTYIIKLFTGNNEVGGTKTFVKQ